MSMSSIGLDPSLQARSDPYYKRNHMGKVTCTLCNIYCVDDTKYLGHINGKTHRLQLQRMERQKTRSERLEEDARLSREAAERAALQKAARDALIRQMGGSAGGSGDSASLRNATGKAGLSVASKQRLAPYGKPVYHYRTETDAAAYETKVWLEFVFKQASDNSRPLHRWRSAREQEIEPVDESVVYLLVACEGYETVAIRFPACMYRTSQETDTEEGRYLCTWDPLKKLYSLFFVLY